MAYTTINKSTDYFNTKLYTGNSTDNHTISGVGFQPDFLWIKDRDRSGYNHRLQDSVRGATKSLMSNLTNAEQTNADAVKSFNSDGFVLGDDVGNGSFNGNSNFVAWNWKANGAGSSNTDGSITSTVSANTTSGFSIVSYTGNNTNGQTVGHGLGVAPKVIMIKNLQSANDWISYHEPLGNNKYLVLNKTDAEASASQLFSSNTNTIGFPLAYGGTNPNNTSMIAYCFAEKKGFSKFGSYTGNGNADGTFIYTGFKPQLVIIKQTSGATNWAMNDIKRQQYNAQDVILYADTNGAESDYGGNYFDILSNGFKMRLTSSYYNGSGNNYIYMAFAAAPLVGTNNVPCTAR